MSDIYNNITDDTLDLLTAYALDALEPAELGRVGALLEERPELRQVLNELRATVDRLPYGLPEAAPPADLRERTLRFATTGKRAPQPAAAARPAGLRGWLVALSGLAAAALIAAGVSWAQLGGTQRELAQTQAALATAQAVQQQVADVTRRASTIAQLNGDGGSGTILRTAEGTTLLAVQLPPLEAGRTYQLWLLDGQSAPISAGVFDVDANGVGLVTLAVAPQTLRAGAAAITNEPDGGSAGPTTPILVQGTFS